MTGSNTALLLPFALLAGCAANNPYASMSEAEILELMTIPEPCGVSASRGHDENGDFFIVANGDTIRPCQSLDAAEIAHSCRIGAGELVYDPEHPHDERYARFEGPVYTVSDVQCLDATEDGSEVLCDFTIADEGEEIRIRRHAFRHVYSEMHDEISHTYMTYWSTRESCIGPSASGD